MFMMVLPLYLTRKDLKQKLGWPYSPTHTTRLQDTRRNADPFPPARANVAALNKRHAVLSPQSCDGRSH
jgi:hypothetical protein